MAQARTARDPKWRRLPEERPQQILEAAFEEFREHGLAGARLDDIARRAGVAKGTIYLYFPNKEELFRDMIRHTVIARLEEAERAFDALAGTAADQVRSYMRQWWAYLMTPQFQTVYRLVHGELHRFPDLAQFYGQEVVARSHRLVRALIARGVETGEFRPVDSDVTARILAVTLISHAVMMERQRLLNLKSTPAYSPEHVLEQLTDFFLHALRPTPGTANAAAR
jgi:AcrR family transcriptional regulator